MRIDRDEEEWGRPPMERDFVRRDRDLQPGGLGTVFFHGMLILCALISVFLRIVGIGG
jgi:hypothetical protein